jgi:uncharacterized 2Fe-2S/4Fe-4S cluster protein (DUF4445 family)
VNAPAAWLRAVQLPPPTLSDNTADVDRLAAALKKELRAETVAIDLGLQRELPGLLRRHDFRLRCSLFRDRGRWVVTGIDPLSRPRPALGLAVDLGTTRVALRLVDLADGRTLAESACDNPQTALGPDVLTRIHYAARANGRKRLTQLIRSALNSAAAAACRTAGFDPRDIRTVAAAGNTAMTHFLLGLDPQWLIREPYIPVVNRPGLFRADELDLEVGPYARVLVFPNIGSYFGGDLIAGILSAGLHRNEETAVLVDVGTNAEVVLGNRDWLVGCAGAAGPALEGGVGRIGMTAAPGAVDRVRIDPASLRFELRTIGGAPPRGICGSGMIDLAAELFRTGMIDRRGKIVAARCGPHLAHVGGIPHILVVPAGRSAAGRELTIGQPDLDSLMRSKAAMYTILETLALTVGVNLETAAAFYVAGAFGCLIDPRSAVTIGMLPDLPLERFVPLGNSSLAGAALTLTSPEAVDEIDRIRDRITYLELNVNQEFMNRFSAAKFIPHTDLARFPSAGSGTYEKHDAFKKEGLP